eukprot:Partr_v1_DN27549_c0_g1_i3_m30328 putative phosphatidylethanolamine N-methyltransferase
MLTIIPDDWLEHLKQPSFLKAVGAIVFHVMNYNATAQLEYRTRFFTKAFGRNTIYFYACYLVFSALIRDQIIQTDLLLDQGTITGMSAPKTVRSAGILIFVYGILLNLWTLKELGIKGMYNGDSFGWLFKEPVTTGPFEYFSHPQYLGTVLSMLGSSIYFLSFRGLVLTLIMALTFVISTIFIESPHMAFIYANRKVSSLYREETPEAPKKSRNAAKTVVFDKSKSPAASRSSPRSRKKRE